MVLAPVCALFGKNVQVYSIPYFDPSPGTCYIVKPGSYCENIIDKQKDKKEALTCTHTNIYLETNI
jgi:hypothetical protein